MYAFFLNSFYVQFDSVVIFCLLILLLFFFLSVTRALARALNLGGMWNIFNKIKPIQGPERIITRRQTVHVMQVEKEAQAEMGPQKQEMKSQHASKIWCHCRRSSFDDMVQCDNPGCKIRWYHMACVQMTMNNVPDLWYCAACRG